jgi:hypothetical protein
MGGPFQLGKGLTFAAFTDGLSNTLLIGEKHVPLGKFGVGWWDCSIYNGDYNQCSTRAGSRTFPLTTARSRLEIRQPAHARRSVLLRRRPRASAVRCHRPVHAGVAQSAQRRTSHSAVLVGRQLRGGSCCSCLLFCVRCIASECETASNCGTRRFDPPYTPLR